MSVSPSGNAEKLVRPLDVSEPTGVADSCTAAAEAFAMEEREYQDDDEVQCGARRPVKIQDPKPRRECSRPGQFRGKLRNKDGIQSLWSWWAVCRGGRRQTWGKW